MRIKSVQIENFRSISSLTCDFGEVTTLVGPNGSGKSNVLRALDWFFNGDKGALTSDDIHRGGPADGAVGRSWIRVKVDFTNLTDADRQALGPRYCPNDSTTTFTAWRTWKDGKDKITGRAFAYPPFEDVRKCESASEKRAAYNEMRALDKELELPSCNSALAVDQAMDEWERSHPDLLTEAEVSDTHFFGIGGREKLASLFDFVFVSADLRTREETSPTRDSLLSRILQRALERETFEEAASALADEFASRYGALTEEHLGGQLNKLATELTNEVSSYTQGREIKLRSAQAQLKPVPAPVEVHVAELATETPIALQGHGFQRTLLLAALTVLSMRHRSGQESGQMFLAIEEPELFQHPTQARAFASVLRQLASDSDQHTQVAYATHSPHFVSPTHFDDVRRVSTMRPDGSSYSSTTITQATIEETRKALEGYVGAENLSRRWDQVCLKYLPDALFAERVILVEGDEDAAILEGMGSRVNDLAVSGICVAPVSGKSNMLIPFAILRLLGVPALMVVDNDSGCAERMTGRGKSDPDIQSAVRQHIHDNRALCRFVEADEQDYPIGAVGSCLAFVPDTMETLLASDLPGWQVAREQVIEQGRGVEGKNAATYSLAARECKDAPGERLQAILDFCVREVA